MMPETMHKLLHTFAALADLGQEVADTTNFQEMARTTLHLLIGSLAIRRGAIAEYEYSSGTLNFIASRGLGDEALPSLNLPADQVEGWLEMGLCCFDCAGAAPPYRPFIDNELSQLNNQRLGIVLPLVVRSRLVGVIFLGDKASGDAYTADDREVLCAMARHIGVGIQERRLREELERRVAENRNLYDSLRVIYQDTVRAFAAAIDCKDKYTQGHSERVGKYSEIIAREMGWSEDEVEGIAVAGYLHDIGKLVVERDILNAPYRIDAKQSSELNRHPAAGYEILSPIRHPYANISLMARYHHERPDGRGYPDGLKSDEIPLGAKIVALADSFDAMTTDRPYKRRRSLDEVIEDFRDNAGKQFAPEVVACFCRALLKEIKGESKERRFLRLLGKDYVQGEGIADSLGELIEELESQVQMNAVGSS